MLSFKFGADGSEYSKGLDKMRKDTKAWAGSVKGMIGGAIGVGALVAGFQKITEAAKELNKQAKLFDVSTTTIQKFGAAAEQAGFTFDNLADAMHDMTEKAQDAANGNKNYAEAFEMMGLKAEDFMNLSFEEKVKAFGDGLKYAGDQGLEFLAANELAGGAAQELIGTFKDGGASFFEYADGINAISEANVQAAVKAADAWAEVKNEMVGLSDTVITSLSSALPYIKAFGRDFSRFIGGGIEKALILNSTFGKATKALLKGNIAEAKAAVDSVGAQMDKLNERLAMQKEISDTSLANDLNGKSGKDDDKSKGGGESPRERAARLAKELAATKEAADAKRKADRDEINAAKEKLSAEEKLQKMRDDIAETQKKRAFDQMSLDEQKNALTAEKIKLEKEFLAVTGEARSLGEGGTDAEKSELKGKALSIKKELLDIAGELSTVNEDIASKEKSDKEKKEQTDKEAKIEALEAMKVDEEDNLITTSLQSIGGGGGFSMLGDPMLDETKKTNTKLDELIANTKPAGGTKDVEI